ncbi:hypothetical protein T439DRAFT_356288 [Meredithblackwellia eburnea MCA 4105]
MDKAVGPLLIATWGNTCLVTVEVVLAAKYFSRFTDPFVIVAPLVSAFALDATSTIADYITVYLYTISHWGDSKFMLYQPVSIPVYVASTGASAAIAQLYLTSRFSRLASRGNKIAGNIVALVLVGLTVVSFAGALWTAIFIGMYPSYVDRGMLRRPVTIWLALSAGADVAIAASLVWQLLGVQKMHKVEVESHIAGFIRSVIVRTVETGSATAGVAAIALGMYLKEPEANIATGFAYCLGRLYTISMLLSLLSRDSEYHSKNSQPYLSQSSSAANGALPSHRLSKMPAKYGRSGGMVNQIQVSHVATVHVEDEPISLDPLQTGKPSRSKLENQTYRIGVDVKDAYTDVGV